jgi:hypothetical protein
VPKAIRHRAIVRPITGVPIVRETLDADLRARLEAVLRPDVARLRELTGRRFESWSI